MNKDFELFLQKPDLTLTPSDFAGIEFFSETGLPKRAPEIRQRCAWHWDAMQVISSHLKEWSSTQPAPQSSKDKKTMVIIFSDDHFGKKVFRQKNNEPDVVFNIKIAEERIDFFMNKAYGVLSKDKNIDRVVFALVGDHIEGDGNIYPNQIVEMETSAVKQMESFVNVFMKHLIQVSNFVNTIDIYSVPGNHGSIRGRYNSDSRNNWDTHIAVQIKNNVAFAQKMGYLKKKNIYVEYVDDLIPERMSLNFTVRGWTVHLEHILPANLTTPSGDLKVKIIKENTYPDIIITGHFHYEMLVSNGNTTVIRSGSLCGYDEFAYRVKLAYSPAVHQFFVCSEAEKIESYYSINLEGIKNDRK